MIIDARVQFGPRTVNKIEFRGDLEIMLLSVRDFFFLSRSFKQARNIFFFFQRCCGKVTGQGEAADEANSFDYRPLSPSALLTPEGSAARGENRHMLPL